MWLITLALLILSTSVYGIDMKSSSAIRIEVIKPGVTFYQQESVWFGMSCQVNPLAVNTKIKTLRIGDVITQGDIQLKIGFIKVNEVLESVEVLGKTLSKKGDVICMAAVDEQGLPTGDECNGLWVHIPQCRVLEP